MLVLLRWWFVFCLCCFGLGIAYTLGFFGYMLRVDHSYMGIVTLSVFVVTSIWIGFLTYRAHRGDSSFTAHLPTCWFISEGMMGLGMVGTLVGFLVLLSTALGSPINTADTAAMATLISKMGVGFATAALATLVGLVCSLLTKLQLVNLEYLKPDNEKL